MKLSIVYIIDVHACKRCSWTSIKIDARVQCRNNKYSTQYRGYSIHGCHAVSLLSAKIQDASALLCLLSSYFYIYNISASNKSKPYPKMHRPCRKINVAQRNWKEKKFALGVKPTIFNFREKQTRPKCLSTSTHNIQTVFIINSLTYHHGQLVLVGLSLWKKEYMFWTQYIK